MTDPREPAEFEPERSELVPKPDIKLRWDKVLEAVPNEEMRKEFELMEDLAGRIRDIYSDYNKYQAYHWLTGSSPNFKEHPIADDFPEELSVYALFQKLIDRYE